MKIYIVKYCANEYDDLGYDSPYPIYYSLDKDKARAHFEQQCENAKKYLDKLFETYPEYKDNEDYGIVKENEIYLEYSIGNWFYQLEFDEAELDKDIRYES